MHRHIQLGGLSNNTVESPEAVVELTVLSFYEGTEGGIIKAVVNVCVSRSPAALVQSGGGLICHKCAGTNYQQASSDHTQNNTDNLSS